MAIQWGSFESSGGNGIRVGIDVDWSSPGHGATTATATIKIWTENQFTFSDSQTLSYGGSISSKPNTNFTNNDGSSPVLRETLTYVYTYTSSQYGSSPGDRTFTASLSGAYNGVTPSKSVTSAIPARPIDAPAAPSGITVSRISDTSLKVSWNNNETAGEPYEDLNVQRDITGTWATASNPGGTAASYTYPSVADRKYRFQVRAHNSEGYSGFNTSGYIWTSPAAPSNAVRTPSGSDQVISWDNNVSYTEAATEVWASKNSTAYVLLGTVTVAGADDTYTHLTTHPSYPYTAGDKWKYKTRTKSTSGSTLYSAYTAETTETSGSLSPPNAPINLQPNGLTVDPTQTAGIPLTWTFSPVTGGDTQQNFAVKHRLVGTALWTTATGTTAQTYSIAANVYADGDIVEWQVATKGAHADYGPYAAPVMFTAAVTPIAADPVKVPVELDLSTGQLEANFSAFELRNYMMRVQSQLTGGGVRTVDGSYNISWSQRFITIALGNSDKTFPSGHHDIVNPFGWVVTTKALTSNVATLTVSASTMRMRPGETIKVSGVGAPFDGNWVVRSIESNKVSYDVVNANVTSVASGGNVFPLIKGHGGSADGWPAVTTNTIGMVNWTALWYELPFGWGSGATPRKNGVVQVTNKALTSNVATLTVPDPHYFVIGDQVIIAISDAVFDGEQTITAVTKTTISFAKTNANITSVAVSPPGLASPTGKNTFFGNFHLTSYTADVVVPDNWVLLALRNGDALTIEWGTGDTVDPGFDSDSPVLKQVILNSVADVTASAGNKPALRIGNIAGTHLRIDGDEIQRMSGDTTVSSLNLNNLGGGINLGSSAVNQVISLQSGTSAVNINTAAASTGAVSIATGGGGVVTIGGTGGSDVTVRPELINSGFTTTASAANVFMQTGGRFQRVTSSRRFKKKIRDIGTLAEDLLKLKPRRYRSKMKHDDPDKDYVGFIAEEAEELGLTEWVEYDEEGKVVGFYYPMWTAALQAICQAQDAQIKDLMARVESLESKAAGSTPV